ncbi:MAG: class I SAM-dependent methyltransferase [Alphaproteobacteria bacterium]
MKPDAVGRYGDDYYDQCGENLEKVLKDHVFDGQVPHYDLLRRVLLRLTTPERHRRWLDIGSAGCPTAFDDFEFTTMEPSAAAVAFGRRHFRADRIHCGVIDTIEERNAFDGVVFLNSLYCTPTPDVSIAKAAQALKDDGLLVIAIGNYFVGSVAYTDDGVDAQLEDVWRGVTMWVYYNPSNIKVLCARFGFTLVTHFVEDSPFFKHHTLQFWVFRKTPTPPLVHVGQGALMVRMMIDKLLHSFRNITAEGLAAIDRSDHAVVGWRELMADMWEARPLTEVACMVDARHPEAAAPYRLGPLRMSTMLALADAIREGRITTVVVAALGRRRAVLSMIVFFLKELGVVPGTYGILVPNRRSAEGRLFGEFQGRRTMIRGLAFRPPEPGEVPE